MAASTEGQHRVANNPARRISWTSFLGDNSKKLRSDVIAACVDDIVTDASWSRGVYALNVVGYIRELAGSKDSTVEELLHRYE